MKNLFLFLQVSWRSLFLSVAAMTAILRVQVPARLCKRAEFLLELLLLELLMRMLL